MDLMEWILLQQEDSDAGNPENALNKTPIDLPLGLAWAVPTKKKKNDKVIYTIYTTTKNTHTVRDAEPNQIEKKTEKIRKKNRKNRCK